MKFSIIIPVYNIEQFIKGCVDSILAQSYLDIEIILVDDGSVDGSSSICDEYGKNDNRIKVIHQKNKGVSVARNAGMAIASGEYVLFIDGDDYWEGDFITSIEQIIKKNNSPDFIFNNAYYIAMPKGEKLLRRYELQEEKFNSVAGEEALIYFFEGTVSCPWSVWRSIYKRKIIKENNLEFEEGVTLGEDADWLFRFILCSENNLFIEMPIYNYRVNRIGSAMNSQSYKNLMSYLNIIKKWMIYADETKNIHLANVIRNKIASNYMGYFKYIYSLNIEDRNKLISEIQTSNIIKYTLDPKKIKIKTAIEKKGYKKVLRGMYLKRISREYIKTFAKKLGIIDR